MSGQDSSAIRHRSAAVAVLTSDSRVVDAITTVVARSRCFVADNHARLLAIIGTTRARKVVIDRAHADAAGALREIESLSLRGEIVVVMIQTAEPATIPGHCADVVVEIPSIDDGLRAERSGLPPGALDQLISISLLPGSLDRALDDVADRLARGFGVDGCVLSLRGDSSGGGAAATQTWSSLTWTRTTERCRTALAAATTLIAPGIEDPTGSCESYVAVPLDVAGSNGFLGLVAKGRRAFDREVWSALRSISRRLSVELAWRQVHDRTTDELDRVTCGPGLDPLLGIWNRVAFDQLAGMQVSAARRSGFSIAAVVIDIAELHAINTRHGLEVGDRVLRRVANVVRTAVRDEDVVARWSGRKISILLHGASDQAHGVVTRLRGTLAERPVELANGESLVPQVTGGIAYLEPEDDAAALLGRAATAARGAPMGDVVTHRKLAAGSLPPPRHSQQIEVAAADIASTIGGTYRLLHEISRGGMGVVYRAHDRSLERPVAIKMLRPDLAEDRELVERFRIEAAMLAHLQHPNLVQIYSFGHHGGDSYFVMELVEGESLEQAIERHAAERTAISLLELPIVIEQVASALDALHDRGIVHRDVKPANVIRDPFRNRSVLVDVGIARRYGQETGIAGTPGFVAPEVIGDGNATPRSDVYGLAATAYAALTLTRPWGDGDLLTILSRQCNESPRPPSSLRPELAVVDDLIAAALSNDPQQRPASAGVFARQLSAALATLSPRADVGDATRAHREPEKPTVGGARTRGVVFRSISRAIGVRETERLREALDDADLANTIHEAAPLSWVPTDLLVRLLAVMPSLVGRDRPTLARDVARATVRASFRRFFPASAATLVPDRTLSAIRSVWGRYHSWGSISSMQVQPTEVVVKIAESLQEPALCEWTIGMLEQLVVLSGGKAPLVNHEACVSQGADACMFRVAWTPME